jgi:hypothetical protein
MNRTATALCLAFIIAPVVAAEAAPIPKKRPVREAAPDPQTAISRLMQGGEQGLGVNVAAYAPPAPPKAELSPARSDDVALYLVGKLSEAGGPIGDGLTWRVFREFPAADGALPLVAKHAGGDLDLRLKPGRYIVHVSYGRATVARTIELTGKVNSETFVLNAGGLQLAAKLEEGDPVSADTTFELYRIEGEERELIGSVKPGAIARLPAGAYHVISRYGDVNAIRTANVTVESGKLTRVTLSHQAGTISLRLARDAAGEALADTAWTVFDANGDQVFERVGAHASVTLAAGEYDVVARHRNNEFRRKVTVNSGDDATITVVASQL